MVNDDTLETITMILKNLLLQYIDIVLSFHDASKIRKLGSPC